MMSQQNLLFPAERAQTSTQHERRVWARQATNIESFCQPAAAETASEPEVGWSGEIIDISRGGIGLRLERRFEPGTTLVLELPSTKDEPSRFLRVRVIHTTPQPDGPWVHGCKFFLELSEAELQAFV